AQELLVYGCIPVAAVVATVNLRKLRNCGGLPGWMLRSVHQLPAKAYAIEVARKMSQKLSEGNTNSILRLSLSILCHDPRKRLARDGMPRDLFDMMIHWAQWPFQPLPQYSSPLWLSAEEQEGATIMVLQAWRKYGGLPVVALAPNACAISLKMRHNVRCVADKTTREPNNPATGPAAQRFNLKSVLEQATGSSTSFFTTCAQPQFLAHFQMRWTRFFARQNFLRSTCSGTVANGMTA
ncbi:hypothetical protein BDV98DRAFT_582812, partial [Pterulicium gracile]